MDITQQLVALSIALSGLKRWLPADAADVHDTLARLQQRTIALADALRHMSHDLHPGVLKHAGLVAALKAHCAEWRWSGTRSSSGSSRANRVSWPLSHGNPYFSGAVPRYIFGPASPDISALCTPIPCLYNPA